jgi:hypothetical protein
VDRRTALILDPAVFERVVVAVLEIFAREES